MTWEILDTETGDVLAAYDSLDVAKQELCSYVEAYPEQVAGRDPQRGAYLHTGPESLFEEFGFVRDRRIAKWRWVMRLHIPAQGVSATCGPGGG